MSNAQQKWLCQLCSCVPPCFPRSGTILSGYSFLHVIHFPFTRECCKLWHFSLLFWYNCMTLKISHYDFSIHASFLLAMPAVLHLQFRTLWLYAINIIPIWRICLSSSWPNTHIITHTETEESSWKWRAWKDLWTLATLFLIDSVFFFSALITVNPAG